MSNLILERLSKSELSRIRGGRWEYVNGEWLWVAERSLDDPYPLGGNLSKDMKPREQEF